MPVTVKRIVLWRTEVENKPGALAAVTEPLARAGADLRVVMGYRHPTAQNSAAIEVYPITGRKLTTAASGSGLAASTIPTLLVEGDNKAGLSHAVSQGLADAGINIAFFMAQAIGRKYTAVVGFETDEAAKKAVPLIKKAANKRV
jgi:hypothetical protein